MKKNISFLTLLFLIILCAPAQARIDIVPQKIIIDSRERNGEFTILNLFDVKGTFRVELVNFQQGKNGVYEELSSPLNANFDPQKIIRFSPRQFTLDPYGRQKIRLSLRKPADLPNGEYRVHIKATRLAQEDERRQTDPNAVSVLTNIGVTIPVIIRHGNVDSDAKIDNLKLVNAAQTEKPELHLDITRNGNASTVGKLEVFLKDSNGNERRIGRITNMNVFTEIQTRNVQVPLYEDPAGKGQIIVRYYNDQDDGKVFDEANLPL